MMVAVEAELAPFTIMTSEFHSITLERWRRTLKRFHRNQFLFLNIL